LRDSGPAEQRRPPLDPRFGSRVVHA
jgi:hypothetical protein